MLILLETAFEPPNTPMNADKTVPGQTLIFG
jgi:hypothetical protein